MSDFSRLLMEARRLRETPNTLGACAHGQDTHSIIFLRKYSLGPASSRRRLFAMIECRVCSVQLVYPIDRVVGPAGSEAYGPAKPDVNWRVGGFAVRELHAIELT